MTMMHRVLALAALCHAAHGRLAAEEVIDVARCQPTRKCAHYDGRCVPPAWCVPSPTVACEPDFCQDPRRCTCMMDKPCRETDKCTANGGECVKNCKEIDGVVKCKDLCDPDSDNPHKCMCEIKAEPPCTQTRMCLGSNGSCVPTPSCDPTVAGIACEDFCGDPDLCICQVCKLTRECASHNGKCVPPDACDPAVSTCEPHYCGNPFLKDCVCKIDNPPPPTKPPTNPPTNPPTKPPTNPPIPDPCDVYDRNCRKLGGTCTDDCDPMVSDCDVSLCGYGDRCACESCKLTDECDFHNGKCVPPDACDPAVSTCEPHYCGDGTGKECVCKIDNPPPPTKPPTNPPTKPPTNPPTRDPCDVYDRNCRQLGGTCTDDCDPTVSDCDVNLCGSGDRCACESCQETDECTVNDGECVPTDTCVHNPPAVICEPHFCGDATGDKCTCKIKAPEPCKDVDNKCQLSRGKCVKGCKPIFGVRDCIRDYCADETGDFDACQCQVDKCRDVGQECRAKGGVCKVAIDCVTAPGTVCDPDLCGSGDLCVCEYDG